MALSDTTVRQAKITGKAYTLGDNDGLSLAVSPEGGKSWFPLQLERKAKKAFPRDLSRNIPQRSPQPT